MKGIYLEKPHEYLVGERVKSMWYFLVQKIRKPRWKHVLVDNLYLYVFSLGREKHMRINN
jgi:hypothetical protein